MNTPKNPSIDKLKLKLFAKLKNQWRYVLDKYSHVENYKKQEHINLVRISVRYLLKSNAWNL